MEINRWRSGSNPSISVVLPTIPSTDHTDVVKKLKSQLFSKEWEVLVVVDDESEDRRCEARNLGIREADSDIIAHTDDDVSPPEMWLDQVDMAFDREEIVCVEGSVYGGMNYEGAGLYRGCNMAVRREEALRVGGWNEDYAGWRDDTEFGWRLEEKGNGACIYVEDMEMKHPPKPRTSFKIDQELDLYNRYTDKYRNRIPNTSAKKLCLTMGHREIGQRLLKLLFSL